jgi:hypothetical protein
MQVKWPSLPRWTFLAVLMLSFCLAYLKLQLSPVPVSSTRLVVSEVTERFAHLQRGWPATFQTVDEFSGKSKHAYGLLVVDVCVGIVLTVLLTLFVKRCLWREHPLRMSLRTLLLATAILGTASGWCFYEQNRWQREQNAVAELQSGGVQFDVDRDYSGPDWLERLGSPRLSVSPATPGPTAIRAFTAGTTRARLQPPSWVEQQLERFNRVVAVRIQRARNAPASPFGGTLSAKFQAKSGKARVAAARSSETQPPDFDSLREFSHVQVVAINDLPREWIAEILMMLARSTSLAHLDLSQTEVDSAGIAALGPLPKLKVLDLTLASEIDDDVMETICRMPALEAALLTGTQVTDRGARRLLELPKLRRVSLPFRISDDVAKELTKRGILVE